MRGMGRHAVATGKLYDIDEQIGKSGSGDLFRRRGRRGEDIRLREGVRKLCVAFSPVDVRKMIREA